MKRLALLLTGLFCATLAQAEVQGERLIQGQPAGYVIGFRETVGAISIVELVPEGESVSAWSEMLTVQGFTGLKSVTPAQFEGESRAKWLSMCTDGKFASIARGEENGYPFALWMLSCPRSAAPGKPEITWFKAMRGNDNFYVVQKAFRFEPAPEQIRQWMQYLKRVTVCDPRLPDRPCPVN